EAALELRLRVQEVAALALERPAVRQVQLEAEDAHEARRHRMTDGIGAGRSTRTLGDDRAPRLRRRADDRRRRPLAGPRLDAAHVQAARARAGGLPCRRG